MTVRVLVGKLIIYFLVLVFLLRPAAASLAKRFFPNLARPIAAASPPGLRTPFLVSFFFSARNLAPVPNLGFLLPATAYLFLLCFLTRRARAARMLLALRRGIGRAFLCPPLGVPLTAPCFVTLFLPVPFLFEVANQKGSNLLQSF